MSIGLPALASPLPTLPGQESKKKEKQKPRAPSLTEEERNSLLESLLSGVGAIGMALDKPGAAARGVLSGLTGGPWGGGLANLIPFSDTFGITSPEERVWGRELLENWGVAAPNKPGLGITWEKGDMLPSVDWENFLGDVAGFATEIGTDPALLLTGPLGTVTKAGKLAKALAPAAKAIPTIAEAAAGFTEALGKEAATIGRRLTPITFAEQIRRGERGLLGIRGTNFALGAGSKWAPKLIEGMFYGGRGNPMVGVRSLLSQAAGAKGKRSTITTGESSSP